MRRLLAFTLLLAACSDSTTTDAGGDARADTATDTGRTDTGGVDSGGVDTGRFETGTSDTGGSDTGVEPVCPPALPDPDGSCTREGLICEYGMPSCLSRAECVGGGWQVAVPRCTPPPAGGCPATREDAQGAACPGDEGARCDYEGGLVCTCTSCPNPYPVCMEVDPPVWACEAPNADETCPVGQPNLGTACAMDAQVCDYGCEPGERRVCEGGVWTPSSQPGGCPMSTRRAKREIEYLDGPDVDALAAQVQHTRLATYEYIDPALSGRRHLGFIIEDQPASYSVDPERSQVDLYGYTSMLVAAIQTQERRIQALERELSRLRVER